MRFWDSSALVALVAQEAGSARALDYLQSDRDMLVWWGTEIECASAVARLLRQQPHLAAQAEPGFGLLRDLAKSWRVVAANEIVRETALRFVRVHPLRAADALQLAAAFVAARARPPALPLVTFDARLAAAARAEGFPVLDTARA